MMAERRRLHAVSALSTTAHLPQTGVVVPVKIRQDSLAFGFHIERRVFVRRHEFPVVQMTLCGVRQAWLWSTSAARR